jgi:hypothetical protein
MFRMDGLGQYGICNFVVEAILGGMWYVVWSLGLGDEERAMSSERSLKRVICNVYW